MTTQQLRGEAGREGDRDEEEQEKETYGESERDSEAHRGSWDQSDGAAETGKHGLELDLFSAWIVKPEV